MSVLREIKSKWPGKCRRCHDAHTKGATVYWTPDLKGVLCRQCYIMDDGPAPSKPSPPQPSGAESGESELGRTCEYGNMVPGHLFDVNLSVLRDVFQCAIHATPCLCVGCRTLSGDLSPRAICLSDMRHADPEVFRLPFPVPYKYSGFYYIVGFYNLTKPLVTAAIPVEWIRGVGNPQGDIRYAALVKTKDAPNEKLHEEYLKDNTYKMRLLFLGRSEPDIWREHFTPKIMDAAGNDIESFDLTKFPTEAEMRKDYPYPWFIDDSSTNGYEVSTYIPHIETNDGPKLLYGNSKIPPEPVNRKPHCECNTPCTLNGNLHADAAGRRTINVLVHSNVPGDKSIVVAAKEVCAGPFSWPYEFHAPDQYTMFAKHGVVLKGLPSKYARESNGNEQPKENKVEEKVGMETKTNAGLPAPANLSDAAVTLIAALQASAVPEERVKEIVMETVQEQLSKLPPKKHRIKIGEQPDVDFEGTLHSMAAEVMEAIMAGFHNIMIVGPAGSGKTYLFSQIAGLLKNTMQWDPDDYAASMSCAPGQTESMFIGRMIPSLTTGTETYHGTNLTRLYARQTGGAFLFDELSNSEPTVMNLVNSMIALDGHVTLPDGRVLKRPEKMVIFAADNTWGQGGDRMYIRNQLDAATLDRFTGAKFFMDYDTKLEAAICPTKDVFDAVAGLRKRVGELKLRRIVSTRAFSAAYRMSNAGSSTKSILKRLTIDWSENDRKSVGV